MLVSTALKISLAFKLSVGMGFIPSLVQDSIVLQNMKHSKQYKKDKQGRNFF